MPFFSSCACGRPTDSFGGLCDRCVALQSLDLPSTATAEHIDASYRTLVKVWHPDRFQNDPKLRAEAEDKLKEINAAHEYLLSPAATEQPARSDYWHKTSSPGEESSPAEPEPAEKEPENVYFSSKELRKLLKKQNQRTIAMPKMLRQTAFGLGSVAMIAVLGLVIDSILASNPKTAPAWDEYKTEISRDLHSSGLRLWSNATTNNPDQANQQATVATPLPAPPSPVVSNPHPSTSPAPTYSPARRDLSGLPHIKIGGPGENSHPYVTSGLTPAEVLAILGNPTSSSGEKMFYKGSEIDFKNGRVAGWKIDPGGTPLPVKLWPDTAPVAGLTKFGVGSTRSDVINVQGTPTLFSDSKFGYGNSFVFFENDRVVGWSEDPASVRLRVAR